MYARKVIESFFASMKREKLYRKKYRTENELYQSIYEYMEFYNSRHPHSKIQYKTSEQKEREYNMVFGTTESEQIDLGGVSNTLIVG